MKTANCKGLDITPKKIILNPKSLNSLEKNDVMHLDAIKKRRNFDQTVSTGKEKKKNGF